MLPGKSSVLRSGRAETATLNAMVEEARMFRSAEEFARHMNPVCGCHTNPQHIRDSHEAEHRRLVAAWQLWHELGMLLEAQ